MATAALREQIESERRTIRILESELALLLARSHHRQSRKRSHEEAQWEQQSKHEKADSSVEGEVSQQQQRQFPEMEARSAPQHSDVMKDKRSTDQVVGLDDKDLLFILDALQSTPPTNTGANLSIEARWQDDPVAFRLMPRLGGIAFTSVSGPVRKNFDDDAFIDSAADDDDTIRRKRRGVSYELCGIVTAKADDDSEGGTSAMAENEVLGGRIKFRVVPTVEFETTHSATSNGRSEEERERAKVVGIESSFGLEGPSSSLAEEDNPMLFPNEELRNLSNLTSKSCDLPQLFRNLVTFTEFHTKRVAFYQRWKTMFGEKMLELDGAETFRVNLLDKEGKPSLALILSWRWKFTPLGRGEEELRLVDCSRRPRRGGDDDDDEGTTEYGTWMNEIMDPSGLQDLVSCSSGCGAAVELLLKACGPPMEDVTK